jgi:hypothetical protein
MTMTESMKAELLHSERWEDEGGATVGNEVPLMTGRFVRPMLKTAGLQDIPRQWSRNFTIESIQAGTAFGASKRNAASRE